MNWQPELLKLLFMRLRNSHLKCAQILSRNFFSPNFTVGMSNTEINCFRVQYSIFIDTCTVFPGTERCFGLFLCRYFKHQSACGNMMIQL